VSDAGIRVHSGPDYWKVEFFMQQQASAIRAAIDIEAIRLRFL